MRPTRLVHTADVHLGIGAAGPDGYEEQAFSRAITLTADLRADGLLIAGDLFDHARVTEELLCWTASQLDRAGCPVILLTGNHDTLHSGSVHRRFRPGERCAAVTLLDDPDGSVVELPGTDVVVWGRAMIDHTPAFHPLAGIPARPADRWGVVAGHGQVLAGARPRHHASPITSTDLDVIDWDYVALGHQHGHEVVRDSPVPAVYPGATASSRKGEAGVVLVEFVPQAGATFQWAALS